MQKSSPASIEKALNKETKQSFMQIAERIHPNHKLGEYKGRDDEQQIEGWRGSERVETSSS